MTDIKRINDKIRLAPIDEIKRLAEDMRARIVQMGDIANEAILNPHAGEDRQALAMILEIARGME